MAWLLFISNCIFFPFQIFFLYPACIVSYILVVSTSVASIFRRVKPPAKILTYKLDYWTGNPTCMVFLALVGHIFLALACWPRRTMKGLTGLDPLDGEGEKRKIKSHHFVVGIKGPTRGLDKWWEQFFSFDHYFSRFWWGDKRSNKQVMGLSFLFFFHYFSQSKRSSEGRNWQKQGIKKLTQ